LVLAQTLPSVQPLLTVPARFARRSARNKIWFFTGSFAVSARRQAACGQVVGAGGGVLVVVVTVVVVTVVVVTVVVVVVTVVTVVVVAVRVVTVVVVWVVVVTVVVVVVVVVVVTMVVVEVVVVDVVCLMKEIMPGEPTLAPNVDLK